MAGVFGGWGGEAASLVLVLLMQPNTEHMRLKGPSGLSRENGSEPVESESDQTGLPSHVSALSLVLSTHNDYQLPRAKSCFVGCTFSSANPMF